MAAVHRLIHPAHPMEIGERATRKRWMDGEEVGRVLTMGGWGKHGESNRSTQSNGLTKLKTLSAEGTVGQAPSFLAPFLVLVLVLVLVPVLVVVAQRSGQAPSSGNLGGTDCPLQTTATLLLGAAVLACESAPPPTTPAPPTCTTQDIPDRTPWRRSKTQRPSLVCGVQAPCAPKDARFGGRLACLCRPLFSTQPTHSSERSPCPAAAACLALPAFHSCQPLELLDSRPPLSLSHPRCCDSCPPRHSCADGLAWTRADLLDTLVYFIFFLPRSVLVAPAFLVVPVVSVIPILHLTLAFVVTLAILAASFSSFPSLPFRSKQQQALSDRPMQGARAHPPVVVAPELPARVSQ